MATNLYNQRNFKNIDFSLDNVSIPQDQADYTASVNPTKILKDPRFLQDLRDYYEEKEGYPVGWSDEALIDAFYSDSTWRELNTVSAIGGAFEPWGMGTESRERAKRIESVWKQLPMFWQEGGRGAATALPDIAGALIADPLNLIPVGAAANTAKGAIIGGKTLGGAVARGAGKAALYEGGIAGAQEGIVNASTQARDIQLGLRDEFSKGELGAATALGAGLGGIVGGGLGIPSALAGAAAGRNVVNDLLGKGLTREQIAALPPESLKGYQEVSGILGAPQQADEVVTETAEETVPSPITIDQLIAKQEEKITNYKASGAEVDEEETFLVLLQEAKKFDEVIKPNAEELITSLQKKGPKGVTKAREVQRWLNEVTRVVENIRKEDGSDFDGDLDQILAYLRDNPYGKKLEQIASDDVIPVTPTGQAGRPRGDVELQGQQGDAQGQQAQPQTNADTIADEVISEAEAADAALPMEQEVADYLRANGIDPQEVTVKKGETTVSMKRAQNVVNYRKRKTKKEQPDVESTEQAEFNSLVEELTRATGSPVDENVRASLARTFESEKGLQKGIIKIDDDIPFEDTLKLSDDATWRLDNQLDDDEFRQYKKILQRFRNQEAKSPEDSKLRIKGVSIAKARTAFLNQRANKQGKARTTGESIERAGQLEGAGRPEGRIQGILKKGDTIGKRPGYADNVKYGDRETAYLKSKEARRDSPNRLVAFYANQRTTAIDETGKEVKAPIGTKLYADGYTRKVFLNKEAAFKRTGLNAPDGEDTANLIGQSTKQPKKNKLPPKLNAQEALNEAIESGDARELLNVLRAIQKNKVSDLPQNQNTIATPDADVAPPTRGDKRLIVQNKNNPDDVRIISKKQVADGKGIEAIIGQKGGAASDPSNWTVKYAPADTKVYGSRLRELFESLPDEQGTPSAGSRVEAGGATGVGEPIDLKDALELRLTLTPEDLEILLAFNRIALNLSPMGGGPMLKMPTIPKGGANLQLSYKDIRDVILFVSQGAKWSKTIKGHREVIRVYKGLMDMESRLLPPEGFIDSTASRQKTLNNLDKIFHGYDAEEIASARRLIERLGGNPELGPRMSGTNEQMRANFYATSNVATDNLPGVNILPKADVMSGLATPMNVKLLHEVAHWAFDNILTPRDRLEFLEKMSKYYDESGQLDVNKIDEGAFTSTLKPEYEEGKSASFANSLDAPGEFFANQFAAWAGRNDKKLVIKDETFWQKALGYIKGTFDRFFYKTPIDPELEPFFLKILPNKEEIGKRSLGTHTPKTKAGKAALEKHTQLSQVLHRLQEMTEIYPLGTTNPETFVSMFTEDMWLLANMVYNKQKSGAFKMLSPYSRRLIKERLKDVNEIFKNANTKGEDINWVELANEIGNPTEAGNAGVSIIDPAKMETVAEHLTELFHHGYQGPNFKGGDRFAVRDADGNVTGYNYGNIKDLERTSMSRMFDFALDSLERNFAKVEDTNKVMSSTHTEAPDAVVSKKKSERGAGKKSNSTKRILNKEATDFENDIETAKKDFKDKKTRRKESKVNTGNAGEIATKSLSVLQKMLREHAGTEYGRQISEQIIKKLKTSTMSEKAFGTTIPRKYVEMSKFELEAIMNDANAKGMTKERDFAVRELQRRMDKRKAKKQGMDTSKHVGMIGRSKKLDNKIKIEINDSNGIQMSNGIPANARPMVKDILSRVTHRDPEKELASRTIIYRLLNVLGKVSRKGTFSNPILARDIAKIIGRDYLARGTEEFSDFQGGDFSILRTFARGIGQELNSVPGDETVRYLSGMALRASMTRQELDVITFAFNQLSPKQQQKIMDTYKKGGGTSIISEGAPDELVHEYAMVDWLAGNFQKIFSSADERHLMNFADEMLTGVSSKLDQRYTEGDVFGTLSEMYHRNMEEVAYIMNGLVKDDDFKKSYFGLTRLYGDMFVRNRRGGVQFPIQDQDVFHSSHAADAGKSAWKNATPEERIKIVDYTKNGVGHNTGTGEPVIFYHGTPNKKALDGSDVGTVMNLSSSNSLYGRGIYLTRNPVVAEESYARKQTKESLNFQIQKLPITDEGKDELEDVAYELAQIRGKISLLKRQNAKFTDADENGNATEIQTFIERVIVEDQLRELTALEKGKVDILEKSGITLEPYVMPSYIQLRNPLDFRENTRYSVNDKIIPTISEGVYVKLKEAGETDADILDAFVAMEEEFYGLEFITGVELYESFGRLMNKFSSTKAEAKDALTDVFEELGHDGLTVSHTNTITDVDDIKIGNAVYHEGVVLFKPNQVKHVRAKNFDGTSGVVFNIELGGGVPQGTNGSIIMAAIDEPNLKVEDIPTGKFGELLEVDGKSRTFTGVASSMIKKRPHNEAEVEVIRNSSAPTWFQSQSDRLNKIGARFLGNWYKNHFVEIAEKFAGKFMPIAQLMRDLPDSDGSLRRWFRKSTGSVLQKQPESYTKIVRALRRDVNSRQYKALNPQEKAVVDKIRQTLDEERRALKLSGFHVGYRKNYIPQVWNQNAIRKNKDEFIQGMHEYYVREQASLGKVPADGEAQKFAEQIYLRLSEDAAEDGVFLPHKDIRGLSKNPGNDSVDFSRVLNIGDYPESLNAMEKFLENDLDAILVKYLEGSTRRLVHADKMGVNTHAVSDYILASNDGAEGIAKLLSTSKVFKKSVRGMSSDGMIVESVFTDTIRMPFEGNEFGAKEFAQNLIKTHAQSGSSAARKMLYDLYPKMSVTYKRRADAIIGALDDFKGQTNSIPYESEQFIDNAMRVAMKKPLSGSKSLMEASKFIRTVNNVTLLGFTTLTSLGDIVLPIIRSGSFSSWASGVGKWATDPDYRRMLNNIGVAMENIVHERMVHMYGAPDNKLSHAFFSATLLTPWTDLQRKIAGATGLEALKTMQQQATRHHKTGVPYSQQNAKYKTAHRFLVRYGLEEYLPRKNKADTSLTDADVLNDNKVRMAIIKFADESIFQPNPNDVPLWAQTPIGQLVFQLKSFPLMMTRMGGYVFQEMNQGNFKPFLAFALLGPTFGMATLSVKDIVQSRGGEDGTSPELRKRNIAKALGYDSKTHGEDYNDFLGWYLEGMMIMGGFGLMGDVLHSVTSQMDNGAYGQNRIWSTLLGPSYGLGNAAITGAAGIQDAIVGGDNSNAKERSAWRELATRIPILGGMRNIREGIVNKMAGEQGENSKGSAQTGWGDAKWVSKGQKSGWGA